MKIVLCGSVNFPEKIREVEEELNGMGHDVVLPSSIIKYNLRSYEDAQKLKSSPHYIEEDKVVLTKKHFDEIKRSDAILVVNVEKRGIPNYIGGATLAEIMFALYHDKKIFLLNPISTDERLAFFRDEIEGAHPVVINGNLGLIK